MWEDGRDLERPHQAATRDLGSAKGRDIDLIENDPAPGRRDCLGQEIEAGGLAGAVRSDKRMDRTAPDRKVDVVDRGETAEDLGHSLTDKDRFTGRADIRLRRDT